jgi:MFS family permease
MTLAGPRAGQRVKHRGFMNRVNVGFAALTMNRDLGLTSQMFGFGVGIFFVGYLVFGLPSNLLLNRIGARRMISGMMVTCGLLSGAMAFANGWERKSVASGRQCAISMSLVWRSSTSALRQRYTQLAFGHLCS